MMKRHLMMYRLQIFQDDIVKNKEYLAFVVSVNVINCPLGLTLWSSKHNE